MRIVRAQEHRVMPWKNGGGSTTEIDVFPAGAALDAFDWRISMAGVTGDGAFSGFPGIDRTLAVLEGAGIVLDVAGRAPQELGRETAPASFPGDVATRATLLSGPILDLNVMTRRGRFIHKVTRHTVDAPCHIEAQGEVTVLLSRSAGLVLSGAQAHVTLDIDDAAFLDAASAGLVLTPPGASEFFLIGISRAG